jgi:CubicO group peptidase (beta-lactamase class C family)
MLLDHTSGLPSYVEFFRLAPTRESAISLLYAVPLRRSPGDTVVYSDLNFMLLGLLVERVSGEPLERFVASEVFVPLGLTQTGYRPSLAAATRIVPSGRRDGRPVAGAVNDRNAARLGGVAGHAGVFSTGADLARYAQFWLASGAINGQRLFSLGTVGTFLEPASASAARLLGWERPEREPDDASAYGSRLSARAFGHTGWTGTMLWIDPARDLFLVFLTNRSYGPRIGHSIRALRQLRGVVSDAVVDAVDGN